jgi:hypothetical protein
MKKNSRNFHWIVTHNQKYRKMLEKKNLLIFIKEPNLVELGLPSATSQNWGKKKEKRSPPIG